MKRCFPSEINGCYYSLTLPPPTITTTDLKALFSLAASTESRVVGKRQQDTVYKGGEDGVCIERHFLARKQNTQDPCIASYHQQKLGLMHYLLAIILRSARTGRIH